jgi:hypothetical protein
MTMSYFSLSTGATTSFKPIYKRHEQQWGIFSLFFEGATTFIKI